MKSESPPDLPDYRDMCRRVAETAANWAECSDLREMAAVFRELGRDCRDLIGQKSTAGRTAFALYDYDLSELASRRVYWDQAEAASDADRLNNVIVIELPIELETDEVGDEISKLCDCELPGRFYSGVPGILACVIDGKLVPGADIERCDACQRYESDEAARNRLIELGIAPTPRPPDLAA